MLCKICGEQIPAARLEAIPDTETCVNCSNVRPYRAIINGSPKNKQYDVEIVKGDDPALDYFDEDRLGGSSDSGD